MITQIQPAFAPIVSPGTKIVATPFLSVGAEIHGVNLTRLSRNDRAMLRALLLKHKMLLIRKQTCSERDLIAFTKIFGDELHRTGPSLRYIHEYPEIFRIANQPGAGNLNTGQYWHADGHYLPDPTPISVMHMVHAAPDGHTLIADTAKALQMMSLAQKNVVYRHGFLARETGVAHSMVKAHPVTGALALHVNLHAAAVDSKGVEHANVSRMLEAHLTETASFVYKHMWQDGDVLVLDNFATAHKGMRSSPEHLRVMHRTSVTGASAWWNARRNLLSPRQSLEITR